MNLDDEQGCDEQGCDEQDFSEIIDMLTTAAKISMLDDEQDDEDQNPRQMEMIEPQQTSKKMKQKAPTVADNMAMADEKVYTALLENLEKCAPTHDKFHLLFLRELIKAITVNNAAKHFVGIQPMSGPVGLIYALIRTIPKLNDDTMDRGSLEIISHAIEAQSTELGTKLTEEAVADISLPYLNTELFEMTKDEISSEIYQNIRNDIMKVGNKLEAKVNNKNDLMLLLGQCANEIGAKTKRGCGNFIIASQTIVNILGKDLDVDEDLLYRDYGYVKYVGTLNGLKVYLDNDMDGNQTIVGYKGGNGETDAGYIYCPYMPVQSSGIIIDAANFNPIMKFSTRFGLFVNQKVTEVVSEDGNETVITREPCNYYVTLDITLPSVKFDDNTTVETVKNVKNVSKTVKDCPIDTFDDAMKLLD